MENTVEIIAQNLKDAKNAQRGGAKRIELVAALSEGGLTPSYAMAHHIINNVDIEVAIMVRPHSKSFCYDEDDLAVMKKDAEIFQKMGASRLVLGILDKNYGIDKDNLSFVLENIHIPITFHRAINESNDILEATKVLNDFPQITHILTSGGRGYAVSNLDTIREMILISNKKIMLGYGMNMEALEIVNKVLPKNNFSYDIHFGSFVQGKDQYVDSNIVKKIVEKFKQQSKYLVD